jgi:uncharacterized membrane protein YhaH (DUF805 family)
MGFTEAIISALSKYFRFSGRALRSEYWFFFLFNIIITIITVALSDVMNIRYGNGNETPLVSIYALLVLFPSLAVTARRLHDTGKSGWRQLWVFTGIGVYFLLYWLIKKGDTDKNRFGIPPTTSNIYEKTKEELIALRKGLKVGVKSVTKVAKTTNTWVQEKVDTTFYNKSDEDDGAIKKTGAKLSESNTNKSEEEIIQNIEIADLSKLTKNELEEYGRNIGIDLNKRNSKENLIAQIQAGARISVPFGRKLEAWEDYKDHFIDGIRWRSKSDWEAYNAKIISHDKSENLQEDGSEEENIKEFSDENYYLIATNEIESDGPDPALWAKCIALNKGDEKVAKYDYIEKRVAILIAKEEIN